MPKMCATLALNSATLALFFAFFNAKSELCIDNSNTKIKVMSFISEYFYSRKLKKAIKKANKLHETTKYNYLVLNWEGKIKVVARRYLKELIAKKAFKKGVTINDFDKAALYSTYSIV